ncbi:hypothetical protein GCM10009744_45450 [Kribbella alba]|uniref:Uncharacterized protein n=1 Tax=Kribbella alba TaxID=190197 RepID=A0ABN2FK39_9ACTN
MVWTPPNSIPLEGRARADRTGDARSSLNARARSSDKRVRDAAAAIRWDDETKVHHRPIAGAFGNCSGSGLRAHSQWRVDPGL